MKKSNLLALCCMCLCLSLLSACYSENTVSSNTTHSTDLIIEETIPQTQTNTDEENSSNDYLIPDFSLSTSDNLQVSLSDYRGSVVVLNFWASWCPPCKNELKDFEQLHYKYADSNDVNLFLLNQIDGQRETAEKGDKYLSDNGFPFFNLHDNGEVGWGIFGLQSIPATVVIDSDGMLFDYVLGQTDFETVNNMIQEALK
jgi:Thiol-disulfide isomerase and thioredoxins